MNKFIGIGRLTKDLELKTTQTGKAVTSFTLAINRISKNEGQPEADFIGCVAWNQTAELMSKYTGKGSLIGIEGRIQTRNYEDNTGRKVYVTEIVVDRVEFLESKKQEQSYQPQTYQQQTTYQPQQSSYDDEPIMDIASDDLPF